MRPFLSSLLRSCLVIVLNPCKTGTKQGAGTRENQANMTCITTLWDGFKHGEKVVGQTYLLNMTA
jgi:hypothetical protein